MAWQERDWAKRDDTDDRREKCRPRRMEGAFPEPVRGDACWEKCGRDGDDHDRAERYASRMGTVEAIWAKVSAFVKGFRCESLNDACALTEMLHKLIIATHNASRLDDAEGPDDE